MSDEDFEKYATRAPPPSYDEAISSIISSHSSYTQIQETVTPIPGEDNITSMQISEQTETYTELMSTTSDGFNSIAVTEQIHDQIQAQTISVENQGQRQFQFDSQVRSEFVMSQFDHQEIAKDKGPESNVGATCNQVALHNRKPVGGNSQKRKEVQTKGFNGKPGKTIRPKNSMRAILPKERATTPTPNMSDELKEAQGVMLDADYMDALGRAYETNMDVFNTFSTVPVRDGKGQILTTNQIISSKSPDRKAITVDVDAVKTNIVKPVSQEELRELRTRYFTNRNQPEPNNNPRRSVGTFFPSAQLEEPNMRVSYRVKCNGKPAGSITITSDAETDLLKKHTNGRLETTSDTEVLLNAGSSQDCRPSQAVVCPMSGRPRIEEKKETDRTIVTVSQNVEQVVPSTSRPTVTNSPPDTSYGM